MEVKHDLLTSKFTKVYCEDLDEQKFNAPHHFKVYDSSKLNQIDPEFELLAEINFQEGPIKEFGVNGVCNEDLIAMVIARLEGFQKSPYASKDNEMAITKLEEALLWLRKRTIGRENRGVEGTSKI